jgi:hypothetical protein
VALAEGAAAGKQQQQQQQQQTGAALSPSSALHAYAHTNTSQGESPAADEGKWGNSWHVCAHFGHLQALVQHHGNGRWHGTLRVHGSVHGL